jgi:hypothetical protein
MKSLKSVVTDITVDANDSVDMIRVKLIEAGIVEPDFTIRLVFNGKILDITKKISDYESIGLKNESMVVFFQTKQKIVKPEAKNQTYTPEPSSLAVPISAPITPIHQSPSVPAPSMGQSLGFNIVATPLTSRTPIVHSSSSPTTMTTVTTSSAPSATTTWSAPSPSTTASASSALTTATTTTASTTSTISRGPSVPVSVGLTSSMPFSLMPSMPIGLTSSMPIGLTPPAPTSVTSSTNPLPTNFAGVDINIFRQATIMNVIGQVLSNSQLFSDILLRDPQMRLLQSINPTEFNNVINNPHFLQAGLAPLGPLNNANNSGDDEDEEEDEDETPTSGSHSATSTSTSATTVIGSAGAGAGAGPHRIILTQTESDFINEASQMVPGVDKGEIIQIYLVCDRNKEMTINTLLNSRFG